MQGLAAVLAKVVMHEKAVCRVVTDNLAADMVPKQRMHINSCWGRIGLCCKSLCWGHT